LAGKSKSGDIFGVCGALRQKLLERTSNSDKDVIINKVCDDAFKLWDGVFSAIHSPSPTVEHCMETQERIDKAMAHIRSMGFSVTPKQYHQTGLGLTWLIVAFDLSWDNQQFDQVQKREPTTHDFS